MLITLYTSASDILIEPSKLIRELTSHLLLGSADHLFAYRNTIEIIVRDYIVVNRNIPRLFVIPDGFKRSRRQIPVRPRSLLKELGMQSSKVAGTVFLLSQPEAIKVCGDTACLDLHNVHLQLGRVPYDIVIKNSFLL